MADNDAHPGFAAVQSKIAAKQGISKIAAGAILAKTSKNASPTAKAKNPNLKKVTQGALQRRLGNAPGKAKQ